jgi:hypothetical protein
MQANNRLHATLLAREVDTFGLEQTGMSIADLRDLRRIPAVGPSLTQDLIDLGVRRATDRGC